MKVCIATEFQPSSVTTSMANELIKQGVAVTAFTSQHDLHGRKQAPGRAENEGVVTYRTPSIYIPSIPYAIVPRALSDFVSFLGDESVDIVHAQMFAFYTIPNITAIVKKICKKPLVLTFHGLQHEAFVNPAYRLGMSAYYRSYFRLITESADAVITLSEISRQKAIRLGADPGKVRVLPNGVDVTRFHRLSDPQVAPMRNEKIKILYVGRISASKGVFILLKAAAELVKEYGDGFSLLFAGDGPDATALKSAIAEARINNVTLLGHVNNVEELLLGSQIFVLPSFYEGLPLSLMEAMACGIPVISSSVGDIPALLRDGHNGLLVRSCDVQALVNALRELIERPDYSRQLAQRGFETIIEGFTIEKTIGKLKDIYEEVLYEGSS